jgi:hypothetical protein
MFSDERIRSQSGFRWPMLILGLAMTLIYVLLGLYILWGYKSFTWVPSEIRLGVARIPDEFRNIFAIMLLIYGSYRGWRVYSDYF